MIDLSKLVQLGAVLSTAAIIHVVALDRPGRSFWMSLGRELLPAERSRARIVRIINVAVVLTAVALIFGSGAPWAIALSTIVLPMIPAIALTIAVARTARAVPISQTTAFAVPLGGPPSGWRLISLPLELLNFVQIGGTGAALFALSAQLPDSMPMHFGLDGRPDRYGAPFELALVLVLPIGITILMWFIMAMSTKERFAIKVGGDDRLVALVIKKRALGIRFMEVVMLAANAAVVATVLAMVALSLPGAGGYGVGVAVPALVISTGGIIGALVWFLPKMTAIADELATLGQPEGLGTHPAGWIWGGMIYYAPDDPGIFVPKRSGIGQTLNFARPGAWIFLGVILGWPFVLGAIMMLKAS